ncbi:anaerobic sulfatase maturase [Vibrio sp. FNV 38]|nr:anaerobic sulfatase maturase [Vibrio sp. FNV 38]
MNPRLPYSLAIKPVGSKCNLDCSYCYYLNHNTGMKDPMSEERLDQVISAHIRAQPTYTRSVDFIWHGGEPMLRGLAFYKAAITKQQRYSNGKLISNTIQTNGTLINESWARFFKQQQFMVGISLDGPHLFNDIARIDLKGQSSFERTLRGMTILKQHQVEFNTLTVVNNRTFRHGAHIYRFLRDSGSRYLQFQPCIDHELDRRTNYNWSLSGEEWGTFLCEVFDQWCQQDIGLVYVQFFENCLMILLEQPSQMCHHAKTCGQQLMMESNGDVFSCDHYGYDEYQLGNIENTPLQQMINSDQQRQFGLDKHHALPTVCQACDFLPLCQGGCPKNRTGTTAQGETTNLLCEGYKMFFRHALPRLLKMTDAITQGYHPKFYTLF